VSDAHAILQGVTTGAFASCNPELGTPLQNNDQPVHSPRVPRSLTPSAAETHACRSPRSLSRTRDASALAALAHVTSSVLARADSTALFEFDTSRRRCERRSPRRVGSDANPPPRASLLSGVVRAFRGALPNAALLPCASCAALLIAALHTAAPRGPSKRFHH
jgi:hypothetical protein